MSSSVWLRYRAKAALGERIGLACATAAVVGIVELTTRWVVARPQPVDTDDLSAAREAVRTSCVRLLAGVGVAFCWYLLSAEALCSTSSSGGVLGAVVTVVGLVALVVCGYPQAKRARVIVEVDPASPVPPYEQLRLQIERLTASGVLQPGDQLPAIRRLAGDLGLAPGTVARAYRELKPAESL